MLLGDGGQDVATRIWRLSLDTPRQLRMLCAEGHPAYDLPVRFTICV